MNTPADTPSGKLQDTFEEHGDRVNDITYRHPHESEILPQIQAVLEQTATGKRLLQTAETYKIPVRLIKGDTMHGFSPEGRAAYVSLPVDRKTMTPRLVLELSAALRGAEQEIMGYKQPLSADIDPLEYAALHHAKNLDLVVNMCRVAHEYFQKTEDSTYINLLEEMGHGGLYDAYVRDFASDDLVDVYYEQGES